MTYEALRDRQLTCSPALSNVRHSRRVPNDAHDPPTGSRASADRSSAVLVLPREPGAGVPPRPGPDVPLLPAVDAAHYLVRVPRLGQDGGPHVRERRDPPRAPGELEARPQVQLRAAL